jgi:hypothetical protein
MGYRADNAIWPQRLAVFATQDAGRVLKTELFESKMCSRPAKAELYPLSTASTSGQQLGFVRVKHIIWLSKRGHDGQGDVFIHRKALLSSLLYDIPEGSLECLYFGWRQYVEGRDFAMRQFAETGAHWLITKKKLDE